MFKDEVQHSYILPSFISETMSVWANRAIVICNCHSNACDV